MRESRLGDTKHVSVLLSNTVVNEIKKLAKERRWNKSEAIRFILESYVEERKAG